VRFLIDVPGDPPDGPNPPPYEHGSTTAQMPKAGWRDRLVVLFISMALFLLACACPALTFRRSSGDMESWPGFQALMMGWLGLLFKQIAWYANPVIVLSLVFLLLRRWLTAMIIALVAFAIAANTLLLFWRDLPADEGNVIKLRLEHLSPGFYFWVASIVTVIVGAIILRRRNTTAG
jgi:hypothetical protein